MIMDEYVYLCLWNKITEVLLEFLNTQALLNISNQLVQI